MSFASEELSKRFEIPPDVLRKVPEAAQILEQLHTVVAADYHIYHNLPYADIPLAMGVYQDVGVSWTRSMMLVDGSKPWKDTLAKKIVDAFYNSGFPFIILVHEPPAQQVVALLRVRNLGSTYYLPSIDDKEFSDEETALTMEVNLSWNKGGLSETVISWLSFPYRSHKKTYAEAIQEFRSALNGSEFQNLILSCPQVEYNAETDVFTFGSWSSKRGIQRSPEFTLHGAMMPSIFDERIIDIRAVSVGDQ